MYSIARMRSDKVREVLLLVVVGDYNTSNNSGNDNQQEDEKTETDPSLLASSSSRNDRLVCVFDTGGDDVNDRGETLRGCDVPLGSILLNVVGRVLNVVYRLVLLVDQNAHLQSYIS